MFAVCLIDEAEFIAPKHPSASINPANQQPISGKDN